MLILHDNLYARPATTLTASSAALALPVGATKNADRSYVWQSLEDDGQQTIDIDLGEVMEVDAVAVADVTLLTGGTLALYQRGDGSTPGTATLVATLPTQDVLRRAAFASFAAQSHRHWQLVWSNPDEVTGVAALGVAFLGVAYQPPVRPTAPARISASDPSVGTASVDGQETFVQRTKFDAGQFDFTAIGGTTLEALQAIWRTVGTSTPLFLCLDDDRAWTCWYARLTGGLALEYQTVPDQFNASLPWREVR